MKNIKFILVVIFVVILGAACSSGNNEHVESDVASNDTTQVDSISDAKIDDKVLAQITREYNEKISLLNNDIKELRDSVSGLSVKFKASEESSNFWNICVIVALILSIIAVLLIFLMQKKATDDKDLEKRIHGSRTVKDMQKKIDNLENNVWGHSKNSRSSSQSDYNELSNMKSELQNLIYLVNDLRAKVYPSNANVHSVVSEKSVQQEFYAGNINGAFLMQPSQQKQEKSIVRICETSPGKGEFDILNFAQVRQSNGLDKIIEYTPSGINIQNAEYDETLAKGKCEKEGNAWKVTQPVKIKITKK